jgi:HlyD family secretion protein
MTASVPIAPLPRRRSRWRMPVLIMLGLASIFGIYRITWKGNASGSNTLFAVVARGDLPITVSEEGELNSRDAQPVINEIGGAQVKLVDILPEGSKVKLGDVVATLDGEALQKAVTDQEVKVETADGKLKSATGALEVTRNKAAGDIAKADLELTLAKLDYDSYEEGEYSFELDKRNSLLELARKELVEAEDSLKFTRDMVKKGFAPTEQIRQLELGMQAKKYSVQQGEADLKVLTKFTKIRKLTELKSKAEEAKRSLERTQKSSGAEVEKADAEVASAKRTLELEQAELKRAKQQLSKCEIKAPGDGIVVYYNGRPWDPESKIRPGAILFRQQPIFTLPDLSKLQVKVKVHESVVKKVAKGQTATMTASSLPNMTLRGKVLSVATFANDDSWRGSGAVKEYSTEVSIENLPLEAGLKPGMTANVKIEIKTLHDVIRIPVNGVTEVNGEQICYVISDAGTERRVVEVGDSNELYVEIRDGLTAGEKVALDARTRGLAEIKANPENQKKP